jgi:DNA-binding GntR family transcriptional regulator
MAKRADDLALQRSGLQAQRGALDATARLAPAAAILLSDEVVDRLREAILAGLFAPGDRLREEQLADALRVSRGPIRNALLQLEREGMVVRRRNRGAIVARLSRADLEEVYSLRLAIEPVACEWAARNANDRDLADMQSVIDSYQSRLTRRVSVQDAAEADLSFHDVVYRAARHRRLMRLWQDLRPQVYVFLLAREYVRTREFRDIMITNHSTIRDVISRRDQERAHEVAIAHVQTSYGRVLRVYENEEAEGPESADVA